MSKEEPFWPTRIVVDTMHYFLIREFGGAFGIRDENAIESSLAYPRNKYAYGCDDVVALASAYAYSFCKNHGYIDGNKRVAFAVMASFLHRNGFELVASEPDAIYAMKNLASGKWEEEQFLEWLRKNVKELT